MTEQNPSRLTAATSTADFKVSSIARNSLLNFIGLVIPYFIGFLAIPFIIRKLGVERFGILSLVWVIFGYFGIFDLGLGRTTTKYIADALGKKDYEKIPQYLWTTVILQLVIGFFGLILLVVLAPLLAEHVMKIPAKYILETKVTLMLVALSLPIMLVTSSFRGVLEASQRFDLVNAIKIPVSILFYILPLIGALLNYDLRGIVILLILSRIAGLIAWLFMCLNVYPFLKGRLAFHKEVLRPLFSFSIWLMLSGVLYTILSSVDKFFIGSQISLKAVSYYSAPYEAILRLGVIPGSLSMVLFPAFSFLAAGNHLEKTEKLFGRSVKYLLLSTAPLLLLLIFYAKELLRLWLGQTFADNSALVVQLLAVGFIGNSIVVVAYNYLQGIGRVDITTKYQAFELCMFAGMLWIFINLWGINGAAFACMIRYILFTIFLFWSAFRVGHINFLAFYKSGVSRAISLIIFFGLGLFLNKMLKLEIIGALVLTCILIVSIYLYVLDDTERRILRVNLLFRKSS